MTDAERLVRQALADEAGRAPSAGRLADDLRRRLEPSGHPWRRPALAASGLALVAVAAGAAILVGQLSEPVAPAGPGTATTQVRGTSSDSRGSSPATPPASVTTTIWGTSVGGVTSRVVTGPVPTDPVTVTITVSAPR